MKRAEFFLLAMQNKCYTRRAWVFSAFCNIAEGPEDWKADPYPYRIVQNQMGSFFVDPDRVNEADSLVKIEDAPAGSPPFAVKDRIQLKAGQVPNLKKDVDTTYGNLFFNYIVLVHALGDKIDYVEGRVKVGALEDQIARRLADIPEEGKPRESGPIYVDEYLKFCDSMFYLSGFTQICVPAASPKSLLPPPGIAEYKKKLLEENKDRLGDPAVIAQIDAKLIAYDAEYLKGDISEGFFIADKSRTTVRRKLYLMYGAEAPLDDSKPNVSLIKNSLSEGWDINKFPEMQDSVRAGSFNRGAQTALGGEAVKWLLRVASNINVVADDCGSKLGNVVNLTEELKDKYVGFSVVTSSGPEKLTEETFKKYVGKKVMIRSPMFCKLDKTDYCRCCIGERLALNPTALASAI